MLIVHCQLSWWGKMDSNHRRRSQQIYSLPHLATLVLPRTRAENWNRTSDLLITSQLLYQLSYFGIFWCLFYKERICFLKNGVQI